MTPMMSVTHHPDPDSRASAACLQRLATALSGYPDLDATVRAYDPAPCLAIRNSAVPALSETITVSTSGNDIAYMWSWGRRISDVGDPMSAAQAIAYVLSASGACLEGDQ